MPTFRGETGFRRHISKGQGNWVQPFKSLSLKGFFYGFFLSIELLSKEEVA